MVVPAVRSRNFSLCAALSCQGLINYDVIDRAFRATDFREFLEGLIDLLKTEHENEKFIFIADNASIHKVRNIRELVEAVGFILLFLPPYSPFLNPIENSFSKWKGHVKLLTCNNEEDLLSGIKNEFKIVTGRDCENYFTKMLFYINESRLRREIVE